MRSRSIAAALVALAGASPVMAQGASAHPQCTGVTADACQQAVDFYHYMMPQVGTAITGGNTTLAQGGNLGGFRLGLVPRFALGLRANVVAANVPELQTPQEALGATSPPPARAFTTTTTVVAFPAVDLAVGVFGGIPLGLSNIGGVDVLLSAAYVPTVETDEFTLTPDRNLEVGYGLRVGLLQESLVIPGVGISFMQRNLPTTTMTATAGSGGTATTITIQDLSLKTTAWRLTASKSLLLFGVALGLGQDRYNTSTTIGLTPPAPAPQPTPFALSQNVTRNTVFGDVSVNLLMLKIVGTIGAVSGGDITTYNTFDAAPDKSRIYGSVGVRFGL